MSGVVLDAGALIARDAHVAMVAVAVADVLYTSDPTDLRRLIAACHSRAPAIVRC